MAFLGGFNASDGQAVALSMLDDGDSTIPFRGPCTSRQVFSFEASKLSYKYGLARLQLVGTTSFKRLRLSRITLAS
jgi:hypothetical protein